MSVVGRPNDPSAEKYKLSFCFPNNKHWLQCQKGRSSSAQSLTCWQIAACHSAVSQDHRGNSGTLCLYSTIGEVTPFPQGVCLTGRVSRSTEMGRGSSMKGMTIREVSSFPKMTPRNLLIPICLKIAWIKPSLCLQVLCQGFQYFVHFLWVTEEKMFPTRSQEK